VQKVGARRAVNRPVDSAAAQQRRVRGIHDGIDRERGDVGADGVERPGGHGNGTYALVSAFTASRNAPSAWIPTVPSPPIRDTVWKPSPPHQYSSGDIPPGASE